MTKTIEEILAPKPETRLRIYAYSIADVKQRVAEQLKTAAIKNYRIELDEHADCEDLGGIGIEPMTPTVSRWVSIH